MPAERAASEVIVLVRFEPFVSGVEAFDEQPCPLFSPPKSQVQRSLDLRVRTA